MWRDRVVPPGLCACTRHRLVLCSCMRRRLVVPRVRGVVVPCATCMRVMESSGLGLKDGEVSEAMKKSERAMMDKRGRTIQFCGLWLTGACCRHQHVLC